MRRGACNLASTLLPLGNLDREHPPVPPAPEHPHANWPQPAQGNYPSHGSYGPVPGNQPPYGPPQPHTQQPYGQQSYGQPQYAHYPPYPSAPQWGQPPRPKSSGYRLAAGIVGIVLGFFILLAPGPGFSGNVIAGFLLLVAATGNITAGIVLLAMQRGTTRGAPITSISFAGFGLLTALLAIPFAGGAIFLFTVILATPVIVVMSMGLSREMRAS